MMDFERVKKTAIGIVLLTITLGLQGCLETAKKKYEESVNSYKSVVDEFTGGNGQQQQPQQSQSKPRYTNTGVASGATASGPQGPANSSENHIMTLSDNWLKRDPYFEKLPFDGGNYKIIKSPSNKYINLYIPMHNGLPRVGMTPAFGLDKIDPNIARNDPNRDIKTAFTARLTRDMNTYIVLKYMSMKKSLFTSERLKVDNSSQPVNRLRLLPDVFHIGDFAPRFHVEHMVSTLVSPDMYQKYMCVSEPVCLKYKMPRGGSAWAGFKASEFAAHKAFSEFMDNEVQGILNWGGTLSDTMYLVWQASMGEYDFEKKGYRISFIPHNADLTYITQTRKPDMFKTFKAAYATFLPIGDTGAEALEKKLNAQKTTRASNSLYAVMKVKLKDFKSRKADYSRPTNQDYIVDVVDDKVRFYVDENLTDKVFETSQFN